MLEETFEIWHKERIRKGWKELKTSKPNIKAYEGEHVIQVMVKGEREIFTFNITKDNG